MSDLGISLIRWRDPRTDLPTVDHDQSILLTDRSGRVWTALAGHVIEGDVTPFAWAEWPHRTGNLTVEDVQTLIDAALADASQEEHDAEHQGPTKAAQYRRSAAETRAAVAKARAALGMDTP